LAHSRGVNPITEFGAVFRADKLKMLCVKRGWEAMQPKAIADIALLQINR